MLMYKVFANLRFSFLGNNISRAASFKVLHSEINYEGSVLQNAQRRSNQATNVVEVLSDFALAGGGSKGIHRHTVVNKKLLVRHRLKLLFDPDSHFLEIGLLAGMAMDYGNIPAAGSVAAIGKIHGHYCIVGANDATVKGGAFFPISINKQIRVQELSYLNRLPCIYLVDSAGAYLPLQAQIFPDRDHGGRTFYNEAVLSSLGIPQIALVCGSSTAGGAYCPTMAEEAIIVNKSGVIFLGGPPLVKAATGEIVSEQDLGGADMHCSISGCTDYFAENEEEAFEMCRESILTLNLPHHEKIASYEEPIYSSEDLSVISGKQPLLKRDIYMVLSRILDGSRFKEFKQKFGCHLITGFGYLHGMLVGIIANSESLAFQDAQKGTHFIQLCEKRSIPLIFLQNCGSYDDSDSSLNASKNDSLLKDRAKMVAAHSCTEVPKITVCIGGCYADDNFTMCGWSFKPNFFFSWPLAHISSSRENIVKDTTSIDALLIKLSKTKDIYDYEMLFESKTSAFYYASRMMSDAIILPQHTRHVLGLCLEITTNKTCAYNANEKHSLSVLRM